MRLEIQGDWNKAGLILKNLENNFSPVMRAHLTEEGNFVLDMIKWHVAAQDLRWTPLAERTIELKGGDDTIYMETGELINGLVVRKIKSKQNVDTIYVGASPWKRHKGSGAKMSDLLLWLEYGTDKIPPRPLMEPVFKEVKPLIEKHWREVFKELVKDNVG